MANELLAELQGIVSNEEPHILRTFDAEKQLAVTELVRAMDLFFLQRWFTGKVPSPDLEGPDQLPLYGLNKALSLFLDSSCAGPTMPLYASNPGSQQWADSVLYHSGRLGMCEKLIEYCRSGLGVLSRATDGALEFSLVSVPLGMEAMEREDLLWLTRFADQNEERLVPLFKAAKPRVRGLMRERVSKWRDHFITYDTHPDIDDYYLELGMSTARGYSGQDCFSGTTRFGGKEFNLYRGAVGVLIGWALKHVAFCVELIDKEPGLDLRNIFTIFSRIDELSVSLAAVLGVADSDARQALSAISLGPENVRLHCTPPGGACPSLVKVTGDHVLRPHWGLLGNPFHFMLRELRERYRSDWDRAVDEREEAFRRDLYLLFPQPHIITLDRTVKVRRDGREVTDIDAVLFDRHTRVMALFQLKWQDTFISMRERWSRQSNFLKESNRWVEEVSAWVAANGPDAVGRALALSAEDAAAVRDVCLFVVGRYHAHFSGPEMPDGRAAWGVWGQVMRHRLEKDDLRDPIRQLHRTLREDSPRQRSFPGVQGGELEIRGRTIRLQTSGPAQGPGPGLT